MATPQQSALFKFVVNQTLAGKADQIKSYTVAAEIFGRGPNFDQSIDPAAFSRALASLEKAVTIGPECGSARSMLARIFADIYAFDIAGFKADF